MDMGIDIVLVEDFIIIAELVNLQVVRYCASEQTPYPDNTSYRICKQHFPNQLPPSPFQQPKGSPMPPVVTPTDRLQINTIRRLPLEFGIRNHAREPRAGRFVRA